MESITVKPHAEKGSGFDKLDCHKMLFFCPKKQFPSPINAVKMGAALLQKGPMTSMDPFSALLARDELNTVSLLSITLLPLSAFSLPSQLAGVR